MAAAVVGSVIGAVAVIVGVLLGQSLLLRHDKRTRLQALSREVQRDFQVLFQQLGPTCDVKLWRQGAVLLANKVSEIEADASCLSRRYRRFARDLAREVVFMLVGATQRVQATSGRLPPHELAILFGWVGALKEVIQGVGVKIATPEDVPKALAHYSNKIAPRAGAPLLVIPPPRFRRIRGL